MANDEIPEDGYSGGSEKAHHLVVLVHGLWGNPNHMAQVAKTLRAHHSRDEVHILVAKRNSGSFTYDGIELGGERVCLEIEDELAQIASRGGTITKLSLVGYSLGGLVARYAIGLLHARGVLDRLECNNFTAFASPFLGVRSPRRGLFGDFFNGVGARSLCMSGRQLFGIDRFRDTGKPILAVLADPNSIFMAGLARFKRRTVYMNITNDRTAPYYTTGIMKTDPYRDLDKIKVNFVQGYEDVVLDPITPIAASATPPKVPLLESVKKSLKRISFISLLVMVMPIAFVGLLVNSVIQSVRSAGRVSLHEKGLAGINPKDYRVNLWMKEIRGAVEDAYESLNNAQGQEYLGLSSSSSEAGDVEVRAGRGDAAATEDQEILAVERKESRLADQLTLALAPYQFTAIQALDKLGWRKYPVWIHKVNHSHAAIIKRTVSPKYEEGQVVLNHWVREEFLL
ncbi:putative serine esterase-domain-containing protein [Bombardia bombarda]|uniref:Serine esterase-domain-containing protein n=1 Tax=Bombardia bombarda TaxID=252184 RepID=A0AA39WIM0_9PEZI|nr:putative serine esterase-domain-containing protein [Bombardia bombarda]